MTAPEPSSSHSSHAPFHESNPAQEDSIDLRDLFRRIGRGLPLTIGLALLGLGIAALVYFVAAPYANVTTTSRVVFSFAGYENGEYPDKSKFDPDDLRSPEIITEALKRQGIEATQDLQGKIRAGLTVEGIIPANVVKERDRLRATGQPLPPLIPDEFQLTLLLPRNFSLSNRQRELLLDEITSVYRGKFQRTYADVPLTFGSAFETLTGADFFEYELILNAEVQNILAYLNQQLESARTFRSPTTNLSFSDLLKQTQLFTQIRLNEILGLIRQNGLSKNRTVAMVKMDYYLRILDDQILKATEEEKVVQDLLGKTRERSQDYVLGIKSQAVQSQPSTPLLDQGLINSLLVNDAYNFLIREALKAGLKVRNLESERAVLMERRKEMDAFIKGNPVDQSLIIAQVQKSLTGVEAAYQSLIRSIRKTHEDYAHQQFADAVRVSMQPVSSSFYRTLVVAAAIGFCLGATFGIGLSLLGITGIRKPSEAPAQ